MGLGRRILEIDLALVPVRNASLIVMGHRIPVLVRDGGCILVPRKRLVAMGHRILVLVRDSGCVLESPTRRVAMGRVGGCLRIPMVAGCDVSVLYGRAVPMWQ